MKNKYILCIVILLILGFSAFAQSTTGQSTTGQATIRQPTNTSTSPLTPVIPVMDMAQNLMLAQSNADYRVTPGDVYTLTYAAGNLSVNYTIVVDTSYQIRVSNLGTVSGTGKTFMQVKREAEAIVSNNYPLSGVQLALTQPAVFRVQVRGEVQTAMEIPAWALSRLSSLAEITNLLTQSASIRDVTIRSAGGQTQVYDLFRAQRLGDLSQDPYLRPGDTITFNRVSRSVTINGDVERTGTYQLLAGENVKELIEFYSGGFLPTADKTRIELERMTNSVDIAGDRIFLTEADLAGNFALEHFDTITVPAITQLRPVIFVEGAAINNVPPVLLENMGLLETGSGYDELNAATRLIVPFSRGETYASLIRRNSDWFGAVSDTMNAYIIRNNEHISINLNPILYDASYRTDVLVEPNDRLIIPFRQYFVSVAGAVVNPGRYPYSPDRNWEYYVGLAGGFDTERNTKESITITDITGQQRQKTDPIGPETTITANTNHGLYYFNQYAPAISLTLTIITAILAIITAATQ